MSVVTVFVKCAVCGWEGHLTSEQTSSISFEDAIKKDTIPLGKIFVQECPACLYASKDISKLEFANVRDIIRTPLYRKTATYFAAEKEDPKSYLERTGFTKYLSYALICELNKEFYTAASSFWAASKLIAEAVIDYECDENNLKTADDYLQQAAILINTKKEEAERKCITLLNKIWEENKNNYEVFLSLLVATAFALESEVQPLLDEASKLVENESLPKNIKIFLINQITIINDNLNWIPIDEE